MGKPWGVFSEFYGEKLLLDIKSALYYNCWVSAIEIDKSKYGVRDQSIWVGKQQISAL